MTRSYVEDYTTVIMDGSDEEVASVIIDAIDVMTAKEHGASSMQVFDDEHPTMLVINTKTDKEHYEMIQRMIDMFYPGLCVFNPPM